MRKTVGVLVMEHIAVGLVETHKVLGALSVFPEKPQSLDPLQSMPAEGIVDCIRQQIEKVAGGEKIEVIGIGFPGIIRNGVIEDSPNFQQAKGFALQSALSSALSGKLTGTPVHVFNDADVIGRGNCCHARQTEQTVPRVDHRQRHRLRPLPFPRRNLGRRAFRRHPRSQGKFCGCGGKGHLEGILGRRSIRLRFMDLEPEEVFENARAGDARCKEFVTLCHRALAAATATSIHMEGPGTFFVSGPEVKFIDVGLLDRLLLEMVKMSPLQGSRFEVVPTSDEMGIVGAAVNADHATSR